jgi:hypothetical protein
VALKYGDRTKVSLVRYQLHTIHFIENTTSSREGNVNLSLSLKYGKSCMSSASSQPLLIATNGTVDLGKGKEIF